MWGVGHGAGGGRETEEERGGDDAGVERRDRGADFALSTDRSDGGMEVEEEEGEVS